MSMKFIKKVSVLLISLFSLSVSADINLDEIFSKESNKTILFFFHKDNCGFCEKMIFELDDKNISKIVQSNFIFLDINRDDDDTILYQGREQSNREFTKSAGIDLFPTTVFIDKNQTIVYDIVGYRNKKVLKDSLLFIATEAYKDKTFEEFEEDE